MRVPHEVAISTRNLAFANAGMQAPFMEKLTEARSVGLIPFCDFIANISTTYRAGNSGEGAAVSAPYLVPQ